ncbi:hypothetical protein [uncultured Olleya sp.]|uniref:hypothetical protein n=1 Tax=uncultured Olleya sp. TaxID=757243 RepID=UPI002594C015|nr:hypothetical protein [uncultured Olleya sp.]
MRYFSLLIITTISLFSYSQEDNYLAERISNNELFHEYDIENFYLHTNKNFYFSGESVFFKAYVVNELDNTPNNDTKNLHVNLYDFENKLVSSHMFNVENGSTFGTVELPESLKSGQYTLQLDTQWNRNFKPGSNFSIIINNLKTQDFNSSITASTVPSENTVTYYPESGSLVENNENVIYFKVKSDNPKTPIGRIVETKTGRRVSKIYAINNNYAKATFFYDSEFTAIINSNNKKTKITIPKANKIGFSLYKTKTDIDSIVNFRLSTNKETIKKHKYIYAVLHKKGVIKTKASYNLKRNTLNYNFNIIKNDLYPGLNTISIFDDNNNLLIERSFFYKEEKQNDILAKVISESKDSITLDLNLINITKDTNVSISVMHESNEVINSDLNITNTLLYEDTKFNTQETTDLYFQQQIQNSSFTYKSKTKYKLPFEKEYGIKLKGQLNKAIKKPQNYKVALNSNTNEIFSVTDLNADKKFEFEKLYLTHPSEFALLLLDKKGKTEESRFYIYDVSTKYKAPNILTNNKNSWSKNDNFIKPKQTKTIFKPTELDVPALITNNIETLDEVVLDNIEQRKEKRIKQIKIENPYLRMNSGFSRDYLIDPEKDNMTLTEYLRRLQGVRIKVDTSQIKVYNARGGGNFMVENGIDVAIDGIIVARTKPKGVVEPLPNPHRPVKDFELISVNLSGIGNGVKHQNGIINLISRKGKSISGKNYISKSYKTTNGYKLSIDKLNENKLFYPNKSSEYAFKTIDWIPNLTLSPDKQNIIKIKKPESENVILIINGVSLNGDLLSKIININPQNNNLHLKQI